LKSAEGGADINMADQSGRTAIFHVISTGTTSLESMSKIVKLLLQRGADPDARDSDGWSPLMKASWLGHEEVVQQLINSGANVNGRDNKGFTALNVASLNNQLATVTLLKNHGATEYRSFTKVPHSVIKCEKQRNFFRPSLPPGRFQVEYFTTAGRFAGPSTEYFGRVAGLHRKLILNQIFFIAHRTGLAAILPASLPNPDPPTDILITRRGERFPTIFCFQACRGILNQERSRMRL
jgi:hypothetical protein